MRIVTHREMRNNSGEILRAVASGETVQVTNHGKVAAVITGPTSSALARLTEEGAVRPAQRPCSDLADIQRRRASRSTSTILADSRGSW